MPFVEVVRPERATGRLRRHYEASRKQDRRVAGIVLAMSQNPEALSDALRLHHTVAMGPSRLTRAQREMIAVVVSRANGCGYCMEGHAKDLRQVCDDVDLIGQLKRDPSTARLDPPTAALLAFAEKLAREPAEIARADVDALREHGFDDRDITDAVHNAAFFAYINRVALGLGVELEPFMLAGGEHVSPDAEIDEL